MPWSALDRETTPVRVGDRQYKRKNGRKKAEQLQSVYSAGKSRPSRAKPSSRSRKPSKQPLRREPGAAAAKKITIELRSNDGAGIDAPEYNELLGMLEEYQQQYLMRSSNALGEDGMQAPAKAIDVDVAVTPMLYGKRMGKEGFMKQASPATSDGSSSQEEECRRWEEEQLRARKDRELQLENSPSSCSPASADESPKRSPPTRTAHQLEFLRRNKSMCPTRCAAVAEAKGQRASFGYSKATSSPADNQQSDETAELVAEVERQKARADRAEEELARAIERAERAEAALREQLLRECTRNTDVSPKPASDREADRFHATSPNEEMDSPAFSSPVSSPRKAKGTFEALVKVADDEEDGHSEGDCDGFERDGYEDDFEE